MGSGVGEGVGEGAGVVSGAAASPAAGLSVGRAVGRGVERGAAVVVVERRLLAGLAELPPARFHRLAAAASTSSQNHQRR